MESNGNILDQISFDHVDYQLTNKLAEVAKKLNMLMFCNSDVSALLDVELKDDSKYKSMFNSDVIYHYENPISFDINGSIYHITSYPSISIGFNGSRSIPRLIVFSISIPEYQKLVNYLTNKYKAVEKSGHILYRWDPDYRSYMISDYSLEEKHAEDLVGLDEFFKTMERDIRAMEEKTEIAKKLGASNGINYLIYGNPGTGKTSSVKALAHKLNLPIYECSLVGQYLGIITELLNPKKPQKRKDQSNFFRPAEISEISARLSKSIQSQSSGVDSGPNIKIVLLEDFDRYINQKQKDDDTNHMSALLNALAGSQDSFGTIRIFSANFPENALTDEALRSRITRFIKFELPSDQNIVEYICKIFPPSQCDKEVVESLGTLFKRENMTIRDVNRYLSLHILDEFPLKSALAGFEEYSKKIRTMNELAQEEKAKEEKAKEEKAKEKS